MKSQHEKSIVVPWQSFLPAYSPERAYRWKAKALKKPTRLQAKLETTLHWPAGVIGILNSAMSMGLTRNTGWDLSEITGAAELEAFRAAAKVFRRGVATSISESGRHSIQGNYRIRFLKSQSEMDEITESAQFVIVDQNVEATWPHLERARAFQMYVASEHEKTLEYAAKLITAWESAGKPKEWLVIGGGLGSDVASFAASLVRCHVTLMPTTLLSMIDASIGGKTGVNFPPYGKNQVGAFHFPSEVLIWPGWLQTLPPRSLRAGGAEGLKHALLSTSRRTVTALSRHLMKLDIAGIEAMLPELVKIKSEIVASDPFEAGERTKLNLGHTIGHALEALSSETQIYHYQTIEHGEAVALGICFAATLSERLGYLKAADCDFIWNSMVGAQCVPSAIQLQNFLGSPDITAPELWISICDKIFQDKKQTDPSGLVSNFVLLKGIGKVVQVQENQFTVPVPIPQLRTCWNAFLKRLNTSGA
jgi:3-dehydroquinate synthetase